MYYLMGTTEHEELMDDYNAAQRLMQMNRFEEAARYLRACFVRCEKSGDHASCETLLGELAVCLDRAGLHSDSAGVLTDLVRLVASKGPTRKLAIVHHNLGFLYEQQQDLQAAEREFAHSCQIAAEIGDRRGQGVSMAMRGQLLVGSGRPQEGFTCLIQAAVLLLESQAPEFDNVIAHIRELARRHGFDALTELVRAHARQPELLRLLLD